MTTKKWRQKSEMYKQFCQPECKGDFSEKMAEKLFILESTGKGGVSINNGYAQGKKWMDVTIAMWKHDIPIGLISKEELYEDFPKVWVDGVVGNVKFSISAYLEAFK